MDSREFLTTETIPSEMSENSSEENFRTLSGIGTYTGPWTRKEVVHFLKRTMFGAKPEDINFFAGMSMSNAVNAMLTIPTIQPSPPVKNYDNTGLIVTDPEIGIAMGQTWVNTNTADGTADSRRRASFKSWWLGQMLNQERNIREKMVLFWHNRFPVESNDIGRAIWAYNNNVLLRQNALGNLKTLVRAVTLDTAMLRYLNGYVNISAAPDENYARELQELFTLGRENNPNYNEDDVKKAARVLTGWKIDYTTNKSYFNSAQHDATGKQFSSFYNNATITGRTGATAGDLELDDLMNLIFSKGVEVSNHIVKKLYRYFVYYKIDAATQANVIDPLALLLRTSNWDIKPVLSTLFKSEHFYDVLNQGCQIKSPIDEQVGLCREFGIVFPDASDYVNAYNMWGYLQGYSALLQQNIGDPPDVAGWKAYYQVPQFYEIWINSDTYPKRNQFTDLMITNGYTRSGKTIKIDPIEFTKKLANPSDPNALINQALEILYRIDISATVKANLKKQILLSNQDQDYYWTNAWNAYLANPVTANYNVVYPRLRDLYKYFMNLSEYRLS